MADPSAVYDQVIITASFDLGGSIDSSQSAIAALSATAGFADAEISSAFAERMQDSYRFSQQPTIVAARDDVRLTLPCWEGLAARRISLHPAGVITLTLKMGLDRQPVDLCAQIEREIYAANAVHYRPYLKAAFGSDLDIDLAEADDRGLNLVSPVLAIRAALRDCVKRRPALYPGFDARVVVMAVGHDAGDAVVQDIVSSYVAARDVTAEGVTFEGVAREPACATACSWKKLVYVTADVDACLIVAKDAECAAAAADCVEAAHQMWFLARTWVGVLDQMGTVNITERDISSAELADLERRVAQLSALDFEISRSMVTVESAAVMLREPWQADLIDQALRTFEISVQQRLITQRLMAVDRNHTTAAEILDRANQAIARRQGNQLQLLFAGALAAGLAALIPTTAAVTTGSPQTIRWVTVVTTLVVWIFAAYAIHRLSRVHVSLTSPDRSTHRQRRR